MMRRIGRWFLGVAVLLASLAPASAAMQVERVVSPGGVEAWLIRDTTIPAIAIEFSFRGGAALDPPGKEGLAYLAMQLLTEGAGERDSQAFARALEDRAIGLGFDAGLDSVQGSLKTLDEHRDVALELMRLALTRPRFDPADVERARAGVLADLRRTAEQPNTLASRTWMATAFPDHPYGRPTRGTLDSVPKLTVDDFRSFVAARLARDNLVIGVVGDIDPDRLGRVLDQAFGDLPAHAAPVDVAEVVPQGAGRTIVVRRNVPQSVVSFGQAGIKRDDPDYYAALVVNYIMGGGGFNSRLVNEVREKRGLAYSVYSYLSPLDRAGLVMGGTGTANARVAQSIALIRVEWQRMREAGPTPDELANAKTYLTGSFALQLDSTTRIARMLAQIRYDRLGIDFLQRRNGLIEAVTLDDVRRAARRVFDVDRLLTVVVGNPADMDKAESGGGG